MKFLKITVLLLLTAQLCQAQDNTIVLSTSMLDKANDVINCGDLNGWIFKQGTDTDVAKMNIDTAAWKRLRPDQLSSKYADKNGRVEGWFRIKVKFDSSFLNKPIFFDFGNWAATEFYVDGEPVATRGNTGEKGKAFREYNGDLDPVSMRFNTPAPHILSIHFAGYLSPVPPYDLKAQTQLKGMLQHSRSSTGVKEPIDINALADEYLRLSYHGLRAKDKEFNATMKTDFDNSIGKINIIPQDISRVLLNLYNNAFYATNERQKTVNEHASINSAGHSYEPTVSVTTKKSDNQVIITVSDNGNGIPKNIVDKIFQPFFTTKPTGEGTGLGLSLAYDIIKAHGGTLKVESADNEGSEFIIQLPII